MRKHALLVAASAAAALVLAACGGSSDSDSTSPAPTDGETTAAPTDEPTTIGGGRAEAEAIVAEFSSSPTSINVTEPLSATPEPGALVVGLSNGSPANQTLNFYLGTGAEARLIPRRSSRPSSRRWTRIRSTSTSRVSPPPPSPRA